MTSDNEHVSNGIKTVDDFCQVGESFCQKAAPDQWEKSSFLDSTMAEFEREMRNSMMGKVMDNFEKQMLEHTKLLDDLKHQQEESQKQLNKERYLKHIPVELINEGVNSAVLWQKVHEFLTNPNFDDEKTITNRKANMKCLDPQIYQIILSHGIGAWLSTLNIDHLNKLTNRIYSDTSQWISKIWRFRCSTSLFHNNMYNGFLNVCKVALADRYPKYGLEGYNSLYSRPPVIYINSAADSQLVDYLRINLGLPSDSISLVPNNFELGGDESMDPLILEQLILGDISAGKMPLIIYAFAGSPNTGSMDHLNEIHNLCREHKIWLHMEGLRLAQLALLQVPAKVNTISSKVKSVTLDIGSWLGIPAVPYATLLMTDMNENYLNKLGFGAGYRLSNKSVMGVFPIWMALQLMGYDGITSRIEKNSKTSEEVYKSLKEITSLKMICIIVKFGIHKTGKPNLDNPLKQGPQIDLGFSSRIKTPVNKSVKQENPNRITLEANGIKNLMETVLSFLLDGYQVPSVIVFRYDPPSVPSEPTKLDCGDLNKRIISENNPDGDLLIKKPRFIDSEDNKTQLYIDSLNQWLTDNLSATFPQINLKMITLPSEGTCLRICFQENVIGQDIKSEDVSKFVESVKHHIMIMDSTVTRRPTFQDIVAAKDELVLVDLPAWAGLGCVLFLPESCRETVYSLFAENSNTEYYMSFLEFIASSPYLNKINNINRSLITELRNDDEAFSLGHFHVDFPCDSEDNGREIVTLFCVRFGLITQTSVIEQLVDHVINKAHQFEESSKNLEKLSQLVKDGIVRVTKDLAREQEEKVKQEGIFRQVPYIDSLLNWWSPPAKTQIIGRSLNLSSGEINDTEDIYKYKMQLQSGPNSVFSIANVNPMEQANSSPNI